jgi:hypothetical protein
LTAIKYHRCHLPNEPLVEQDYMVKLHDHHTLDAHFEHIGVNLSAKNLGFFEYHEILHLYGVRVDEATIHDLVRSDPCAVLVPDQSDLCVAAIQALNLLSTISYLMTTPTGR